MTDEIHGEYPPDVESQMVTEATQDSLTREKIKEIAEKMEGELFLPSSTPQPSVLSGRPDGQSDKTGQPAIHVAQGHYTDPRVTLTSGGRSYQLDKLVDAMIASMEALAEAIGLCGDRLMPPQIRAQRSIENVLRKFDEARIQ